MKIILLSLFLAMLILISCEDSTSYGTGSNISAIKTEEKNLPDNTLKVLDFNKVLIQEQNSIQVLDISDTNNFEIISEVNIPVGKEYLSISLERYLILRDATGKDSRTIVDMLNGRSIEIYEENYSTTAININPLDHSILYSLRYFHQEIRTTMSLIKYTTFDNQSITLLDSCTEATWSPNGKWFATAKFMYEENHFKNREHALYNLQGQKVIITREPLVIVSPSWNNDGSALLYQILGDSRILLVEFDWIDDIPRIKRKIFETGFAEPIWSPDGNYLAFIEWYEDGHTVFGNDILITDKNLLLRKPIIQHEDIIETPLFWNVNDGLVTSLDEKICKYEINY